MGKCNAQVVVALLIATQAPNPGGRVSISISFTFPLPCYSQTPIIYTNLPCVVSDMPGIELLK